MKQKKQSKISDANLVILEKCGNLVKNKILFELISNFEFYNYSNYNTKLISGGIHLESLTNALWNVLSI